MKLLLLKDSLEAAIHNLKELGHRFLVEIINHLYYIRGVSKLIQTITIHYTAISHLKTSKLHHLNSRKKA